MTDEEKFNKDKLLVIEMVKCILIALISVVAIYFSTKLILILVPFLIGFLLASASYKLAGISFRKNARKKFPEQDGKRRKIAEVIYILLIIIMAGVIVLAASEIVSQIQNAVTSISYYTSSINIEDIQNRVNDYFLNNFSSNDEIASAIRDNLDNLVITASAKIPSLVNSFLTSILEIIGNLPYDVFVIVCVLMSGWFFISDGPAILRSYANNVPHKEFRAKSLSLINELSNTLFRVLGGYLLLLVITVFESWIFFFIAGTKYSIILSLATGIIDFLPVLGVSAVMLPIAIYNAVQGNFFAAIVLILGVAFISIIRRIIEPAILGKSMKMHPLMTLFGMLVGVAVWGAIGFLLGPAVLIIVVQTMKVFSLDKKLRVFLSHLLNRFMKDPDPLEKED